MTDIAPAAKPRVPLPRLAALTAILTLAAFLLRIGLIEPRNPAITPKGHAALPFATIFAFGVAVVITLAIANRHRWRVVLWWNRGRVIGAVALTFVTPFVVYSWAPWIVGPLYLTIMQAAFMDDTPLLLLWGSAIVAAVCGFWYPVSCLIVSGIKSRWVRFAIFCLIFWSAYSLIILLVGTQVLDCC
jgi:hypothetical protein